MERLCDFGLVVYFCHRRRALLALVIVILVGAKALRVDSRKRSKVRVKFSAFDACALE